MWGFVPRLTIWSSMGLRRLLVRLESVLQRQTKVNYCRSFAVPQTTLMVLANYKRFCACVGHVRGRRLHARTTHAFILAREQDSRVTFPRRLHRGALECGEEVATVPDRAISDARARLRVQRRRIVLGHYPRGTDGLSCGKGPRARGT